jgi:XTP/dITP diphosphohydrolase
LATRPLPRQPLVLASRNPGKIREIRQILLDLPAGLVGLEGLDSLSEPVEDGETFAANARLKAAYYARATGRWCLADDSGLEVDALGGAPGVRSARYAADECPPGAPRAVLDAANNAKLLRALAGVAAENRTARFVCHAVLADPEGELLEACDTVEGRIGFDARGENGFGYDPLFLLPQFGCTTAELDAERKNAISHRGKAMRAIAEMIHEVTAKQR